MVIKKGFNTSLNLFLGNGFWRCFVKWYFALFCEKSLNTLILLDEVVVLCFRSNNFQGCEIRRQIRHELNK